MTTATSRAEAPPGRARSPQSPEDPGTAAEQARRRWRRARWPLAVAGVVALSALLGALAIPSTSGADLDPDSAAPEGTRAVAQILRDQGVQVLRATRSDQVARLAGPGSRLVVVHPQLLGPNQLQRVSDSAADLVLVEPDALVLATLDPQVRPAGVAAAATRPARCADPAAQAAGNARAGGHLYALTTTPTRPAAVLGRVAACYPDTADTSTYSMITGETAAGRTITVLGQAGLLTNQHLAEDGNAALALWSLGRQPTVVWYLPDPLELSASASPPTLSALLPPWVHWVVLEIGIAVGLALAWRARRLGRLVTEPLPVVVRAAETQEGRARLYQQAGARGRAAATLRTACLRRLASRLDVPAEATPDGVAALVAAAARADPGQVRELLLGAAPADDAALVRLADRLDALEVALASSAHTTREAART